MESPVVKVQKVDLLKLHNLVNGVAVKIRHMLSEAELRAFSDDHLTGTDGERIKNKHD